VPWTPTVNESVPVLVLPWALVAACPFKELALLDLLWSIAASCALPELCALSLKEASLAAPFDSVALPLTEVLPLNALCWLSLVPPFEASGDGLVELLEASGVLLDELVKDKLLFGLLSELVDEGLLTELLELLEVLLLSSVAPWADWADGDWLSWEEVLRPAWSFSKTLLLESAVELRLLFGLSVSAALVEASLVELSCEDWLDWPLRLLSELAPWLGLMLVSVALWPERDELELLLDEGDWLSVEIEDLLPETEASPLVPLAALSDWAACEAALSDCVEPFG
jgi:hypothetical protein